MIASKTRCFSVDRKLAEMPGTAMNGSDRYRCLFFHVPRTGGSTIESLDWWDEGSGHFPRAAEAGDLGGHFSFAFVRNPWDRFVSLYHYLATMTPEHRWYHTNAQIVVAIRQYPSFVDFCLRFHAWRGRNHYRFWPQSAWITGANARPLVDFVGRFERLQHDFARVCARLGLPARGLPKLNGSRHEPYPAYSDDEAERVVAALARRDLVTFGE